MDASYQYYENSSPLIVSAKIKELLQTVKDVKGVFISVWHNESLSNKGIWKGWKIVYEQMLEEATTNN